MAHLSAMPLTSPALPALRKESNFSKNVPSGGRDRRIYAFEAAADFKPSATALVFLNPSQMNGSESVSRERTPSLPEEKKQTLHGKQCAADVNSMEAMIARLNTHFPFFVRLLMAKPSDCRKSL